MKTKLRVFVWDFLSSQKWSLVISHTLKIRDLLKSNNSYSSPSFIHQTDLKFLYWRGRYFDFWQWLNSRKSTGLCQTLINFFLLLNKTVTLDGHRRVFSVEWRANDKHNYKVLSNFLKYVSAYRRQSDTTLTKAVGRSWLVTVTWLYLNNISIFISILPLLSPVPLYWRVFCVKVVEFIRWLSGKFLFNVAVIFYLLFWQTPDNSLLRLKLMALF